MFIATINTQYKHFQRFDLSDLLLRMHDHYINQNSCYEEEFNLFWDIVDNVYSTKRHNYINSMSTYELELLKTTIFKNAYLAVRYACIINERIPEAEPAIATNAYYSYSYAKNVLQGPFLLGEKAIAKDGYCSYSYAKHVLNNRFELGEPAIYSDLFLATDYELLLKIWNLR